MSFSLAGGEIAGAIIAAVLLAIAIFFWVISRGDGDLITCGIVFFVIATIATSGMLASAHSRSLELQSIKNLQQQGFNVLSSTFSNAQQQHYITLLGPSDCLTNYDLKEYTTGWHAVDNGKLLTPTEVACNHRAPSQ